VQGKLEKEERDALIEKGSQLKAALADYEERLRSLESALQVEAQRLPNLTHPDVAIGGEENAVVLREVGAPPQLGFEVCCFRSFCRFCCARWCTQLPECATRGGQAC
jgi:seryl-tRNA synthetase